MADLGTAGGGIHPGAPIIWPTGKSSSTPVQSSPTTQTTGQTQSSSSAAASKSAQSASQAAQTSAATAAQSSAAAAAKAAPQVARALTVQDVRSHLLNLQIEPNDFNTALASLMLRNGAELSRANFVKVMTMLQGTNKSPAMQEAAVLLTMKGIDSPQAAQILGQYFSQNPGMANQLAGLQQGLASLLSALSTGKGLLDSGLVSQLGALLSQLDESFQNMTQKAGGDKNPINRQNLLNDVRALKSMLQGVQKKAPNSGSASAQALQSSMMECQGKLDGILQNLVAQSILSQSGRSEVNYQYHQIPNAMTDPPKNLEIVIKKDGEGKNSAVDPRNTQVVMSMETENMGKMVISMYVKDNKVYVVFVFSKKDYGDDGREKIAKEFGELQQKLADRNFLVTGYQVKVDAAMCNIKPYLIPMLPSLENMLKKIDIEA
jgi:hypothetical protein